MAASTSKEPPGKKVAKRIQPLSFAELELDGSNYMKWCIDVKAHLKSDELGGVLATPTPAEFMEAQRSRAIVFMRKHIDDTLESQYLQVEEPTELWRQLEARFRHERNIHLPQAQND